MIPFAKVVINFAGLRHELVYSFFKKKGVDSKCALCLHCVISAFENILPRKANQLTDRTTDRTKDPNDDHSTGAAALRLKHLLY